MLTIKYSNLTNFVSQKTICRTMASRRALDLAHRFSVNLVVKHNGNPAEEAWMLYP